MASDINLVTRAIEQQFAAIEQQIFCADMFSPWRGSFEVKKVYVSKENADIKLDLDVRLAHWPEGVSVKVYKHKALAVLPYVKDESVVRENLGTEPMPAKFWKESFYFSRRIDLDEGRYVLREGNEMTMANGQQCLDMLKAFIIEIEEILAEAKS